MKFAKTIDVDSLLQKQPDLSETIDKQFTDALDQHGFKDYPRLFEYGKIMRFSNGRKGGDLPGWCVLYENGIGMAGDWSKPELDFSFTSGNIKSLPPWETERLRKLVQEQRILFEKEREERQLKAARESQSEWEALPPAQKGNGYLQRKKVGCYGVKARGAELVVPVINPAGEIASLQYIQPDGSKRFKAGGSTKGGHFVIGSGTPQYMAEGYATGASIYEATGKPCVIAFNAGNLVEVAGQFPGAVIVADNDESNTGINDAIKAKEAHGNPVLLIPEKGMDANDYVNAGHDLKGFLEADKAPCPTPFFKSADKLLTQGTPSSWLIKGWIPRRRCKGSIFGASSSGKTFFVLDMALSIATGQEEWNGCKVQGGCVAYLCGEGNSMINRRIVAWLQEHGGIQANRKHFEIPEFICSEYGTEIDNNGKLAQLEADIQASGMRPDLIVIDTLATHMEGNENDTQDASTMLRNIDELAKQYECAVIYTHHTGQNPETQNRSRGSSALKANLDFEYRVELIKDGVREICQTKVKDGAYMKPQHFRLEQRVITGWLDEDGEPEYSAVLVPCEAPEKDLTALQEKNLEIAKDILDEYGTMDSDNELVITRADLLKGMAGRLLDSNKIPLEKDRLQQELQPSRKSGFVNSLIACGFWETMWDARKIQGWRVLDNGVIFRWGLAHGKPQQPELGTDE